jgi:hypothetical protein
MLPQTAKPKTVALNALNGSNEARVEARGAMTPAHASFEPETFRASKIESV